MKESIFNIEDRVQWKGQTHSRRRKYRRLISVSHYMTLWLGKRFPNAVPLVYVVGYPKSGTTWAAQLVADYLRLPHPQHTIFPLGCPAVIQGHDYISPNYPIGVYVVRDGRDVMMSGFHHLKSQFLEGGGRKGHRRFFESIDLEKPVSELLPSFIEYSVTQPFAGSRNWHQHVQSYFESKAPNVHLVRYEDLIDQPEQALSSLMDGLTGSDVDDRKIKEAVDRFSFTRQTSSKKKPSGASYLRKGKKGDWRSHFNRESAELFEQHFGESLRSANYETDGSWVDRLSTPTPVNEAEASNQTSS